MKTQTTCMLRCSLVIVGLLGGDQYLPDHQSGTIFAQRRYPEQRRTHDKRRDPRRRILAALTLLLTGALGGGGIWMLFHPSITPFLIPGATNIQVVSIGIWEWQITYDTSGPPYAWSYTLMHALTEGQWRDRTRWHADE